MHVMEMLSLKGKVALVTGGSGRYGRPMVEALAEAGAIVITISRLDEDTRKIEIEGGDLIADLSL